MRGTNPFCPIEHICGYPKDDYPNNTTYANYPAYNRHIKRSINTYIITGKKIPGLKNKKGEEVKEFRVDYDTNSKGVAAFTVVVGQTSRFDASGAQFFCDDNSGNTFPVQDSSGNTVQGVRYQICYRDNKKSKKQIALNEKNYLKGTKRIERHLTSQKSLVSKKTANSQWYKHTNVAAMFTEWNNRMEGVEGTMKNHTDKWINAKFGLASLGQEFCNFPMYRYYTEKGESTSNADKKAHKKCHALFKKSGAPGLIYTVKKPWNKPNSQ